MKTKLTLLTVLLLILTATVATANNAFDTKVLFENPTEFEHATNSTDESFSEFNEELDFSIDFPQEFNPPTESLEEFDVYEPIDSFNFSETELMSLDDYLQTNDFEAIDTNRIKHKIVQTATDFEMTDDEFKFITSLINEDYDIEKVLDIYEFLRWTDCDYTAIPGIYDQGIKMGDNPNWIYDAYDNFFDRKDDMLSVEDVAYYVSNGITVDEIAAAYELSFAGAKTTKQMLSERLLGNSWNTITATSLSSTPQAVIDAPTMTMDEIMLFRRVSVRQRKDFTEIADINGDRVTLKEQAISAEREKSISKSKLMTDNNITPVFNTKTNTDTTLYTNNTPQTFNAEQITEDDLIPIDEPEVE